MKLLKLYVETIFFIVETKKKKCRIFKKLVNAIFKNEFYLLKTLFFA